MYQNFQIAKGSEIELLASKLPSGENRDLKTTIAEVIDFLNDNDLIECTLNYYGFTFLIENHFEESDINRLIEEYKYSQVVKDSLKTTPDVDPNTRFHVNKKCTHEFVSREYTSQPYGHCLSCNETVLD